MYDRAFQAEKVPFWDFYDYSAFFSNIISCSNIWLIERLRVIIGENPILQKKRIYYCHKNFPGMLFIYFNILVLKQIWYLIFQLPIRMCLDNQLINQVLVPFKKWRRKVKKDAFALHIFKYLFTSIRYTSCSMLRKYEFSHNLVYLHIESG